MILVEGPDGAGKTTLVDQLIERYGFKVGERGTKDRKLLYTVTRSDTYNALSQAVRGDEEPKIWDRLFFSEMVYAPVVGREVEFKPEERRFISRVLHALACPVIVCLPPFDTVRDNALKDEQMGGVNENIGGIYGAYEGQVAFPPGTIWYDYTGKNYFNTRHSFTGLKGVYDKIDDYLKIRKEREVRGPVAVAN